MKDKKGFTLIELLAVIIILGILMLIAIPSVTAYINNSRKSAYLDTIQEIVKGAMIKVNEGEIGVYNGDATYYMPYTCVKTENGTPKSPYGAFEEAYVGITYNGDSYDYYFVGRDKANMGVSELTYSGTMTKDHIVSNVTSIDTGVGIEGRTNVIIIDEDCITKSEPTAATSTVEGTGNAYVGGSGGGGSGGGSCSKYTKDQTFDFEYTGAVQNFTAECAGRFKLEVWGAEGGKGHNSSSGNSSPAGTPGKGGYSVGTVSLSNGTKLFIYAGGKGGDITYSEGGAAGFNGGGAGMAGSGSRSGGGGGGSDIRIGQDSLYARVIVAGGGGGTGWSTSLIGGSGGGTTGGTGSSYSVTGGGGGTQTAGGTGPNSGSFGVGAGSSNPNSLYNPGPPGGGGWYGGGSGNAGGSGSNSAGGGGSGYIYTSSTASNCPSGCLLTSANYLTDAETKAGTESFTSPTGTSETGHIGNGYVRITYLGK